MGPIELLGQGQSLGFQQVRFGRFVYIEKSNVLLVGRRNDVLHKKHQEGFLGLSYSIPGILARGLSSLFSMKG